MASTDPHQGGDLFDMAQTGTTIPNDAGEMNIILSKPRPGESSSDGPTNPTDIPRSFQDRGLGEEVQTGTVYVLNSSINNSIVLIFTQGCIAL
jgi:hypothetical protein